MDGSNNRIRPIRWHFVAAPLDNDLFAPTREIYVFSLQFVNPKIVSFGFLLVSEQIIVLVACIGDTCRKDDQWSTAQTSGSPHLSRTFSV